MKEETESGWEWREHDRTRVLACLQDGEYEAIMTTGQSELDVLAHLAAELGILEAVQILSVERERAGIPDELLLRTLAVLPFVEAMGLSASAKTLFADAAILLQLGYTAVELREGFNNRHGAQATVKSATSLPLHPDVLRQEMQRLEPESVADFRRHCIQQLYKRKLIKGKVYAVDGSGLSDRWRVVGLLCVVQGAPLWVTWRLLAGDASEKGKEGSVLFEMVDEVRDIAGEQAIEWLLMDALYADGPLLVGLKLKRGIDALVRLPETRTMYQDLWDLLDWEPQRWQSSWLDVRYVAGRKQLREITPGVVAGLTRWPALQEAAQAIGYEEEFSLWGCAIHARDLNDPTYQEDWALISTRSFASGRQAHTFWRKRWLIENSGFREIKEGWHLEKAPWSYTDPSIVLARITFTLLAFNVAQIAKTKRGKQLTQTGIRRLRRQLRREVGPAPVIVFAAGAYGIFNIEEIMVALGKPPAHLLHHGNPVQLE
ncbi:MAG: hypothetical protein PVH03_06605 [Chloroflexota bacterium]|jgi:hypothetical protein